MEEASAEKYEKNLKQAYRTAYLIAGFIRDTLGPEEKKELDAWIKASDDNMRLFDELTDEKNIGQSLQWFDNMNVEAALKKTKQRAVHSKKVVAWRWSVAASLVLAVALLLYLKPWHKQEREPPPLANSSDITPAEGKARLTLDDGSVVTLGEKDTIINGQIKISKDKAEIMYTEQPLSAAALVYHTLTVSRKAHYKLLLPDGTIAWLNAESSIRYPAAFGEGERKVFVTGETYFEVAKDKTKPFRVVAGDVTIEALGTKFNVNAYANEPWLTATLMEGSVLVTKGARENILKPGQQAQLSDNDFNIADVDTGNVTAWKDNLFKFRNTPIDAIMRQVERWYDAEVVFEDELTLHLNATIDRDVAASKLLHMLSETDEMHFRIDGKKIIVTK